MKDINLWLSNSGIKFSNEDIDCLENFYKELSSNQFNMGNSSTECSLHVTYGKISIIRIEFSKEDTRVFCEKPNNAEKNDRKYLIQKIITDFKIPSNIKVVDINKESLNKILQFILEKKNELINNENYFNLVYDISESQNEEENINYNELCRTTEIQLTRKERRGQAFFRSHLLMNSSGCKICGVKRKELLIASHIRPWKDSNDEQRLDTNNGFLLCPNHDKLFDKGFISFKADGSILISSRIKISELEKLNIDENIKIKNLSEATKKYLNYHNTYVFKR